MPTIPSPEAIEVAVVGIGRLGGTVSTALERRGHRVHRVRRGEPVPPAPVVWLTVPDGEISAVAASCPRSGVLLHASGATDLQALQPHPQAGSLHPLMTFPGEAEPIPPVPAAIAGTDAARDAARKLAVALGWTPFEVPGDRRAYHAAAVLAGNFATTLLAEASEVLALAGVDVRDAPGLLAPLALQSLRNAVDLGPLAALTGPVVRGDHAVLNAHRAVLLQHRPATLPTYEALVAATLQLMSDRSAKK
jgi:predicted short-subunit dehydrogenase-like oxidoreductase (DUF2520 family)